MKEIPLAKPYFDNDELRQIEDAMSSGWVAGQGPKSNDLSNEIKKLTNAKFALPVNNCTAGLHLSLLALDISKEDEVIVADYTYPATGHSVMYTGAKPVFCDVEPDTFNIDINSLEKLITIKTKAIIVVHTFGSPVKIDQVLTIAKKHNIKLIEDCACALGSEFDGRHMGTFGDFGCFSLHARKGITCGEGGIVITDNEEYYQRIKSLSCFGTESAFNRASDKSNQINIPEFRHLGYNYKLSDINSAICLAQLKKLEKIIKRKTEIIEMYLDELSETPLLPQVHLPNAKTCFQAFVCKAPNRNQLMAFLKDHNIQTQIGTFSSCIQPVYKSTNLCPNSLKIFNSAIALPLFYELTFEEVQFISGKIREFYK